MKGPPDESDHDSDTSIDGKDLKREKGDVPGKHKLGKKKGFCGPADPFGSSDEDSSDDDEMFTS